MGCAQSIYVRATAKRWHPKPGVLGQGMLAAKTFELLKLSPKEINQYYGIFCRIDADGSNEISLREFYAFLKLDRTPWMDRVFTIMDEDQSGKIDFREFVVSCWNYCSFDMLSLVTFAFNMFDLDGSRELDNHEVQELVRDVYGSKYAGNLHLQQVIKRLDRNGDGKVSYEEFLSFYRRYPAILFPAFTVQQELRQRTFGERYWFKQSQKRKQHLPDSKALVKMLKELDADKYKQQLRQAVGGGGAGEAKGEGEGGGAEKPGAKARARWGRKRGAKNKGVTPSRLEKRASRRGGAGKAGQGKSVPGPPSPAVKKARSTRQAAPTDEEDDGELAPPRRTQGAFPTAAGVPALDMRRVAEQRRKDDARRAARKGRDDKGRKAAGRAHGGKERAQAAPKGIFSSLFGHKETRAEKSRAAERPKKRERGGKKSAAAAEKGGAAAAGQGRRRGSLRRADSALPVSYLAQIRDQEGVLAEAAKLDAQAAAGGGGGGTAEKRGVGDGDKSQPRESAADDGVLVLESESRHDGSGLHPATSKPVLGPGSQLSRTPSQHKVVPAALERRASQRTVLPRAGSVSRVVVAS